MNIKKTALVFGVLSLLAKDKLNTQEMNYFSLENKIKTEILKDYLVKGEESNPKIKEFVENAKKYIGKEYAWGGRLTKTNPGLDCLGLLFVAHSKTFGTHWYDFSVYPSKIIEKGQLGKPVKGLDGILTENVDASKLEEGDIIYLLCKGSIQDKPLAIINGENYWPWHTGIYSNKKNNLFLEASPSYLKVIETPFSEILDENSPTRAIFVTRMH